MNITKPYRSDDPRFSDPRYQRRVLVASRPFSFIENMHELILECGHEPLLMGNNVPAVGDLCFCPTCYEGTLQ